mmetsp:Transcript_15874/g.43912  ORF Transcript_15874/g.43912 Transcript_15874/m.43912 type:complete len:364 (+) Transcript_15874:1498-2589(+)
MTPTSRNTLSKAFFVVTCIAVVPSNTEAFRAPENPTGLEGLKTPLIVKKPPVVVPEPQEPKNVITLEALSQVGKMVAADDVARGASFRKRLEIGLFNAPSNYVDEYWYNPTIHTFGNIGVFGAMHAALAPISTKIIDVAAYDGEDIRSTVASKLSRIVEPRTSKCGRSARVLDMCCGVGISTRALQDAFPKSEFVVGLDTSPEMINMAGFLTTHLRWVKPIVSFFIKDKKEKNQTPNFLQKKLGFSSRKAKFITGNAEETNFPSKTFDLVTIMYAFHEAPEDGREKILREAHRILQPGGTLAVIDISTEYTPSKTMLAGEPYVLEYQKNMHRQMRSLRGFTKVQYQNLVQDHVGMWIMKRTTN